MARGAPLIPAPVTRERPQSRRATGKDEEEGGEEGTRRARKKGEREGEGACVMKERTAEKIAFEEN